MAPSPAVLPVVDTLPGLWGFVRAVLRRLTWRVAVVSAMVAFGLFHILGVIYVYGGYSPHPQTPPEMWWTHIVIITIVTVTTVLAILAADEAVDRGSRRVPTYVGALLIGVAVGAIAQYFVRDALGLRSHLSAPLLVTKYRHTAHTFLIYTLLWGPATFIYVGLRSSLAATRRRNAAELARAQTTRRTLESQLQAMQARVEPQFLFNTLAQVRALHERDRVLAGRMLDDLITYLRAALPHLRESTSTLGKEVELAQAYLNIMQLRLGERLSFSFDVPEATREARIPPMLLLPLIDHALVYGLAPVEACGRLSITTAVANGRLRLSVADTGGGFVEGGDAAGLRSIEERMRALYGDAGSFRIERMQQHGARAILEVPYEIADQRYR